MDYTNLINNTTGKTSKVGIIGATRGYGYTLLAQIPKVKHMDLRVICSRHPEECLEVLKEIGYDEDQIIFCEGKPEIEQAPKEAILIVSDYRLVMECGITALVECTGNTAVSSDAALAALRAGVNVYMVSKETDSVCGPLLNQVAAEHGAVYALVNGDQPRNLLDLYSWAMLLGLEVVAAGKSSEYDFVWDRETGEFTCTDGSGVVEKIPQMQDCWYYNGVETLDQRRSILEKYTGVISADLRGKDEASFCGGEFIIVRCENEKMWEILKSKGHVMSRNDKYACIYYPYHYMGLETPISILLGDLMGIGTHPECRQVSVLAGVAERDLPKGTQLTVQGHHHAIDGLIPELLERTSGQDLAPFYLLNGTTLLRDVKKGDPITLEDVDLAGLETYKLYAQGLEIK